MMFTHKFDKYDGAIYIRNDEYSIGDTNRLLLFHGDTLKAPELIVTTNMGLRVFWKEYTI